MRSFPFDELDDVYQDVILAHYKNPRNRGTIQDPDIQYREFNPICGDEVVLQLRLKDGRITEVGSHGDGCSITQASASMMTELLKGKMLEEAERLSESFRQMMGGHSPSEDELRQLGDLEALRGVRKFPVRIKCALLAWSALEEGLEGYRASHA